MTTSSTTTRTAGARTRSGSETAGHLGRLYTLPELTAAAGRYQRTAGALEVAQIDDFLDHLATTWDQPTDAATYPAGRCHRCGPVFNITTHACTVCGAVLELERIER